MGLNTPRMRWIAYSLAAAGTLAAIVLSEPSSQEQTVAVVEPVRRETRTATPIAQAEGEVRVRLDLLRRAPGSELPRADPFALPAPPAPVQPTIQAAPPPPKPQAPALPFTYLGKWTENGKTIVYLARGESHVAVKGPGRLDDSYSVESVDERQIVLTYQPLGVRQVLPLAAGAAPAPSAAAPRPNESEPSEETN
ncbi:hypothetical protein EZ313_01500 [Ramlibacter henchirensis]|uniref:Secretion system X translation initiation factor n=1 Tax=Ramlibacter henchirensis TaxID=204072 RepID=A0A4Z0C1G7_9BURK|nr:hypothetical protein [Ramlibacter henchirensis]TFZ05376.1 hypothetical protein EZ313_01500 [Ramlibacter henchirensis]